MLLIVFPWGGGVDPRVGVGAGIVVLVAGGAGVVLADGAEAPELAVAVPGVLVADGGTEADPPHPAIDIAEMPRVVVRISGWGTNRISRF